MHAARSGARTPVAAKKKTSTRYKRPKPISVRKPAPRPPTPRQKRRAKRHAERIASYLKHRDAVGEALLRAALRCHGTFEAGGMVNAILAEKFQLDGVKLALEEINERATAVLRAEVMRILAANSSMSEEDARELTRRMVARLIPTRDDVVPGAPMKASPQERVEAIEAAIAREARAYKMSKSKQ